MSGSAQIGHSEPSMNPTATMDITSVLYTANADRGDAEARDEALSWWGFSGFHIGTWLNGADKVGREEDDVFKLDQDTIPML